MEMCKHIFKYNMISGDIMHFYIRFVNSSLENAQEKMILQCNIQSYIIFCYQGLHLG